MKHLPLFLLLMSALPAQTGGIVEKILCPATPKVPRISEGDVEILEDGTLLLAYTEFFGGDGSDWGAARIAGRKSLDQGRTWSEPFTIVANSGKMNVMDANLLRLRSGKLALVHALKNSMADCRLLFRTSSDEGKTWSAPITVTTPVKYWGINNDRLVQLKSGRLLAPVFVVDDWAKSHHTRNAVFYSDDEGKTWKQSDLVDVPQGKRGADEPGVIELRDGRVLQIVRTDLGKIFVSHSSDGGVHWTAPQPTELTAPTAPASIARIPSTGDLLIVWNNSPVGPKHTHDRFPLTAAISKDEGRTWKNIRNLDATPGFAYAYTSITFLPAKEVLFTYYAADTRPKAKEDHSGHSMISLKMKIVPVDWFYRP